MRQYFKYIIFNLSFLILNSFCFSQNVDSLKLALKNAKHDTTRCNILIAMIDSEEDDNVWPIYNVQLMTISKKNVDNNSTPKKKYFKFLADAISNAGYFEKNQGNIIKALEYHNKSLKMRGEIQDMVGVATSLGNIGVIYLDQGDVPKALDFFYKSLKIQEGIGDKIGIAYSLNYIGNIYINLDETKKALEINQRCLKIQEEIGDDFGIANSLNTIGGIYQKLGQMQIALAHYQKSLKRMEEIGDQVGIATALNNIGGIYQKQGNFKEALDCIKKCLKIQEAAGDKIGVAMALNNFASFMMSHGKTKEGLVLAKRSMQISKELGYPQSIRSSALILKELFRKQNNYKDAFEMYELEIKMRDSINNQETQKASIKKQMQYTYEKKELETKADQDKKDVVAKAELKQKENERNYFIAGFGLVLVLALFILRGYKQKQKANAIIIAQKHLVEEKQKEIVDSINYAKRIQMALLPNEKYIERNLKKIKAHEGK